MQSYSNLGGDSGIRAFETTADSITVEFKDGSQYLYNYIKPGQADTEEMKRLAHAGVGLNSYIGRIVRKNFYSKLR